MNWGDGLRGADECFIQDVGGLIVDAMGNDKKMKGLAPRGSRNCDVYR